MYENYDSYTDEELIQLLRSGREEITEFLVERYKYLVKKKAHTMYLIGGETEDLIQEGMIGLFKAVRDYQPKKDTSFQTFAGLCIERQLYKAIAFSNRQKNQPLNTSISLDEKESGEKLIENLEWYQTKDPESLFIEQESSKDLACQIEKSLSKMEKEVLRYHLQGYSYTKIAEIMKKPAKSIDNAVQRIRSKVKIVISEEKVEKISE